VSENVGVWEAPAAALVAAAARGCLGTREQGLLFWLLQNGFAASHVQPDLARECSSLQYQI